MNSVTLEDSRILGSLDYIRWNELKDSTIVITGSTGLIGLNLVSALAVNSEEKSLNIKLVLPVRNKSLASSMFNWTGAQIIDYTLEDGFVFDEKVDFVIHLASPTSSSFFSENPVDTMWFNVCGTHWILEWAKNHQVKKIVYLSTMEVYGKTEKGRIIGESDIGSFDPINSRNSYPISKIAVENLCYGFFKQYGVPTVVLRATQTFGPGVRYDDNRVFAQFMRCAVEGKDIVLKSKGLTERCYLYTADAVSAIIVSMIDAESGNAYTIANPETYCSIRDMARMVADDIADGRIKVVFDITEDITRLGYADTLYMDLDISKMRNLGWSPTVNLNSMFDRMIKGIEDNV